MKKKLLSMVLVVLLLLAAVMGCTKKETPSNGGNDALTKDRAGFEITVPKEINRIITMAPSITLTLIDLGLGDKIVAMDTQSAMILEPNPDMPTFDLMSPNVESLAELEPDIIIASTLTMMGDEANDPFAALKALDICVAYIPSSNSIAEIKEDLRFTATVVGEKEKGEKMIADMEREIEEILKLKPANAPEKKVYFEIGAAPYMYSFGSGVYQNEMIEMLGAVNIFSDDGWLPVEAESVVSANPDIIFTNVNYIENSVEEILSRPGWEAMDAIKNKQVFYVENTNTSLPCHYIVYGLREIAEFLYGIN